MNTPIKLLFQGISVATISSFSYETPWASGNVEFVDQEFFLKLTRVTSMLSFDLEMDELDLSDEEEESLWEEKLAELGVDWDDLKLDRDEEWSVVPIGGQRQSIYAVRFYEDGNMDWRL